MPAVNFCLVRTNKLIVNFSFFINLNNFFPFFRYVKFVNVFHLIFNLFIRLVTVNTVFNISFYIIIYTQKYGLHN